MPLSERDKERINLMNPVSNDVKLGNKIAELEQRESEEVDAYTKAEADDKFQPKGSYVSQADFNALVSRVEALENAGDGS